MCDRVSFLATTDGPLQLYFAPGLRSHAAARAGWSMPRDGAECEWTDESPNTLVVRHEDNKIAATVKAMILGQYSSLSVLLATVGGTRGPNGFVVQYNEGKPVPSAGGKWLMDLEVGHEDAEDYAWVTEVSGNVCVEQGATLNAPVLAEVSGYVRVEQGATLNAPVLAEVAGGVRVYQGATMNAPALAKAGYVYVEQGATMNAPVLAKVTGNVCVEQGATMNAPVLAEVSGYVRVEQGATLNAPVLAKAGDVRVEQGATMNAPALAEVSGDVYVEQGATMNAPLLNK